MGEVFKVGALVHVGGVDGCPALGYGRVAGHAVMTREDGAPQFVYLVRLDVGRNIAGDGARLGFVSVLVVDPSEVVAVAEWQKRFTQGGQS